MRKNIKMLSVLLLSNILFVPCLLIGSDNILMLLFGVIWFAILVLSPMLSKRVAKFWHLVYVYTLHLERMLLGGNG